MRLFNRLRSLKARISDAPTLDWVVLTAALAGLAIAVLTTLSVGMSSEIAYELHGPPPQLSSN